MKSIIEECIMLEVDKEIGMKRTGIVIINVIITMMSILLIVVFKSVVKKYENSYVSNTFYSIIIPIYAPIKNIEYK
jgi:uncharacterized protein YggT (Ycf19 family)